MRGLGAAAVAAVMLAAAPAMADNNLDLSKVTCKDFIGAGKDNISIILTWLDAYYKDEDAPPVIDTDTFLANAEKLGQYCGKNPTLGLITAADSVFD